MLACRSRRGSIMWALAALALVAAAPETDLKDMNWLAGSWVSETADGWTEEVWTADRGGLMLGVNRSGKGGKATGFEYMRLQRDGSGRIVFWASPGGKAAVAFPEAPGAGWQRVVFENASNDYPQRIVYERRGGTLTGTISDLKGGKAHSWTFKRRN
jgi:hypothetical protein